MGTTREQPERTRKMARVKNSWCLSFSILAVIKVLGSFGERCSLTTHSSGHANHSRDSLIKGVGRHLSVTVLKDIH
jgi:hypothetical protein